MLLIADSGSTKTDWLFIDKNGNKIETSTIGFNPFFQSEEVISSEIIKNQTLNKNADSVENLIFFGAGVSSINKQNIILDGLKKVFKKCKNISAEHDMKGAAIAACGNFSGIVCILGTGSNSCFYDGTETFENIPSLGYILGDEASGAYFGKILITDFLYKNMPENISNYFKKEFEMDKDTLLDTIYKKPNANVFLASFMKFIVIHKHELYIRKMIENGFSKFAEYHICSFTNFKSLPVHFIGSVAYLFNDILHITAEKHNFKIGKIMQKPINDLAKYYSQKLNYKY